MKAIAPATSRAFKSMDMYPFSNSPKVNTTLATLIIDSPRAREKETLAITSQKTIVYLEASTSPTVENKDSVARKTSGWGGIISRESRSDDRGVNERSE